MSTGTIVRCATSVDEGYKMVVDTIFSAPRAAQSVQLFQVGSRWFLVILSNRSDTYVCWVNDEHTACEIANRVNNLLDAHRKLTGSDGDCDSDSPFVDALHFSMLYRP